MFDRKYLTYVASLSLSAGIWFHSSSSLQAQSSIDLNEAERMLDLNVVELETQLVKAFVSSPTSKRTMSIKWSWR